MENTSYDENDGLIIAKLFSMSLMGIISLIIGCVPILLSTIKINLQSKVKNNQITSTVLKHYDERSGSSANTSSNYSASITSYLLCFGGGVLYYTTFHHLNPEVQATFQDLEARGLFPQYLSLHLSDIIISIGFFLVYLIDEMVHEFITFYVERIVAPHQHRHHHHHHHQNVGVHHDYNSHLTGTLRGFVITIALSLHSIFEGIAVGLEKTVADVWTLSLAIATHKFVIIFCVATKLTLGLEKRPALVFVNVVLLSIMTPIGTAIGIGITEYASAGEASDNYFVVGAILQAIATGILMYVLFFEIIVKEHYCSLAISGLGKAMAMIVGFCAMIILTLLTSGHQHSHGGDSREDKHHYMQTIKHTHDEDDH